MGVNAVFAIMAIQSWLRNDSTVPGNTQLAQILQLHTYLAMTQVTFNTSHDMALLQAALRKGNIGLTRLFQFIATPVGLALTLSDVALSAIELSKAENEGQRILATTQLSFSVIGLSLFVGSLVACLLGSTLLVSGLFILGITLAVTGYIIQSTVVENLNKLDKAKIIANYFTSMLKGWRQAGFTLNQGILVPCQGAVITQVDLQNATSLAVVFDAKGQRIKRRRAQGRSPSDYINLYQLRQIVTTRRTLALPVNAAGMKTLVLPTQPRARINPIMNEKFSFSLQNNNGSEFQAMHFFSRKDADFPFMIYPAALSRVPYFSVPSELQLHYFHTKIDILLGNQHYYLIAPGVDEGSPENPLINPPIYSEHLHYHFHAPRQKAAWVVLVLNRAQANMTIDCVNDQVNWLIDVSHINDIEMTSSHSTEFPAGHLLKFFCRTPTTAGEYMTEVITTISVKNSEETKITLNLPQGAIEWKPQQTLFCRINFTELNISSNQQESIDEASVLIAIQNYLRQQRTHHRYAINRVRLDNYRQQGERHIGNAANELENINDYFYPLSQPALLYTANNDQTIFNDSSQRSNVVLIFHNQTSAWYRGDLAIRHLVTDTTVLQGI
ncbi:putative cytotoxin Mcf [Candidatus Regiella insecticola LSR1]|uniref:Putative cytotoxin Mcf n=2 Tax=Candidatus Regiella insecticola TaxID=138073 RepID=E0WQB9_9ENTR|nr:putative cytotoxin Mcf [Candidatus Regiella insecticola LSR1]